MSQQIDDAKSIISKSGNTFHCKVVNYLQKKDWAVLISPYYNDNISGKPREIDLIATKEFHLKNSGGFHLETVIVKLFIECKYIAQTTVFWFHNKDEQMVEHLLTQTTPLKGNNNYIKQHHYLKDENRVAKLFADQKKKSAENEIFYKALNQSLNSMVYYRNQEPYFNFLANGKSLASRTIYYPVIVCNSFDKIYRVEMDSDIDPINIDDNFFLEVNYAYTTTEKKNKNEYFLIDILNFKLFDNFLDKVEKDINIFPNFLES